MRCRILVLAVVSSAGCAAERDVYPHLIRAFLPTDAVQNATLTIDVLAAPGADTRDAITAVDFDLWHPELGSAGAVNVDVVDGEWWAEITIDADAEPGDYYRWADLVAGDHWTTYYWDPDVSRDHLTWVRGSIIDGSREVDLEASVSDRTATWTSVHSAIGRTSLVLYGGGTVLAYYWVETYSYTAGAMVGNRGDTLPTVVFRDQDPGEFTLIAVSDVSKDGYGEDERDVGARWVLDVYGPQALVAQQSDLASATFEPIHVSGEAALKNLNLLCWWHIPGSDPAIDIEGMGRPLFRSGAGCDGRGNCEVETGEAIFVGTWDLTCAAAEGVEWVNDPLANAEYVASRTNVEVTGAGTTISGFSPPSSR